MTSSGTVIALGIAAALINLPVKETAIVREVPRGAVASSEL